MRRKASIAAATLVAGPANAHAFSAGADGYAQFVEGVAVILSYPGILLPVVALGVLLSLWSFGGLPRAWPVFLAGQAGGIFASVAVGPDVATVFVGLGVIVAAIAALAPRVPGALAFGLAGLTGLGALTTALEGHGLFELPALTYLGLVFGTNLAAALAAGLCQVALDRVAAAWMRIGWRVAASWIAAILVLYLAFELRGGVS